MKNRTTASMKQEHISIQSTKFKLKSWLILWRPIQSLYFIIYSVVWVVSPLLLYLYHLDRIPNPSKTLHMFCDACLTGITEDNFNQLEVLSRHQTVFIQYKTDCVLSTKHALAWLRNNQWEGTQFIWRARGKSASWKPLVSLMTVNV